jgi:transcriptional regulator
MYTPKNFEQSDPDQLKALITNYPLATLITYSETGLEANHIPFLLNSSADTDVLQGHFAKSNQLWKTLKDQSEVLVIFHGPNTYISPNYYPTKQDTGKVVPTWNYVTVHVKGVMSYIHDDDCNMDLVTNLTNQHESEQAIPWTVSDAPKDFTKKMLSGIVGIEITILSMQGKWKLSQNQPEQNQRGVVTGLSQQADSGSQTMAGMIENHIHNNKSEP